MQLSVTRCLSLDAALTTGGRIVSLKDTLLNPFRPTKINVFDFLSCT